MKKLFALLLAFSLLVSGQACAVSLPVFDYPAATYTDIDNSGLTAIGAGTFSRCKALEAVWIPAGVATIAPDAFSGCSRVLLHVESGSAAVTFARQSGLNYDIH